MSKHCMVDLETLAVTVDAKVLSVGAVIFDPFGEGLGAQFYCCVDTLGQFDRAESKRTVEWWADQSDEAKAALNRREKIGLAEAMYLFKIFYEDNECVRLWSHGAGFDAKILEHAMQGTEPWGYNEVLDTRTVLWLTDESMLKNDHAHDALEDAKTQALTMQRCLSQRNN